MQLHPGARWNVKPARISPRDDTPPEPVDHEYNGRLILCRRSDREQVLVGKTQNSAPILIISLQGGKQFLHVRFVLRE